jgi:hypothetical protein
LPALAIPKSDRLGLALLREMPETELSSFLLAIEKAPHLVPPVAGTPSGHASQVKSALDTMYRIRAYHDVPLPQFIEDVCESLREHKELEPKDEPRFRERLQRLLDIDALTIAAKATVLRQEHERNFCSIRIITDARPVYADEASGPPPAIFVTHTMKLSYHEGAAGDLRDFYLCFGSDDIAEIRRALTRAEEKAKGLRDLFEAAQVRLLDSQ